MKPGQKRGFGVGEIYDMTSSEWEYWPSTGRPEHGCRPKVAISLIKNEQVTTYCENHEM